MTRTPLRPAHLRKAHNPASLENGDTISVILDKGFPCTGSGRTLLTYDAFRADWWFACEAMQHFISGQIDFDKERFDGDGDYYVGIYLDD